MFWCFSRGWPPRLKRVETGGIRQCIYTHIHTHNTHTLLELHPQKHPQEFRNVSAGPTAPAHTRPASPPRPAARTSKSARHKPVAAGKTADWPPNHPGPASNRNHAARRVGNTSSASAARTRRYTRHNPRTSPRHRNPTPRGSTPSPAPRGRTHRTTSRSAVVHFAYPFRYPSFIQALTASTLTATRVVRKAPPITERAHSTPRITCS